MTLYNPRIKERKILPNFSKFLKHSILRRKVIRVLSTLLFFSLLGILNPSAGIVQYIKDFAKVLEEGGDKGYLNECWQNNV